MANIITKLKEFRKEMKISQQELAQLVGVRRETIVHLEITATIPLSKWP